MVKKACKYCSRIHERNHVCESKPVRPNYKEKTDINKFRWSRKWTNKRTHIRERDNHLCQVCLLNKFDTFNQYNSETLEVHHIVPLHKDFELRLDDENLITLCARHHKMAENGAISAKFLLSIVKSKY